MKKTILIILAVVIPMVVAAQSSPLGKIFDKYSGKDGYTSVCVSKAMFELFATIADDKEDKDFKDITNKLNSIKILSCETKNSTNPGDAFYREMVRALSLPDYEDLMVIKDGTEEIKFIIRRNADKINELIMIVGGSDACLIALDGEINLKQVAKLSKSMNLKGFEHLNNVGAKAN